MMEEEDCVSTCDETGSNLSRVLDSKRIDAFLETKVVIFVIQQQHYNFVLPEITPIKRNKKKDMWPVIGGERFLLKPVLVI